MFVIHAVSRGKVVGYVCNLDSDSLVLCDSKQSADKFTTEDEVQGAIDECTSILDNFVYGYEEVG